MIRDIKIFIIIKILSSSSSIFSIMRNNHSEIFQLLSEELNTNGQNNTPTNQRRSLNGSEDDDFTLQIIQQRINQLKQKKPKTFLNKH